MISSSRTHAHPLIMPEVDAGVQRFQGSSAKPPFSGSLGTRRFRTCLATSGSASPGYGYGPDMTDDEVAAMFAPDRMPNCSRLYGWHLLGHDEARGWIRVGFEGTSEFLNPAGRIQGGILGAMLDDTMGPAVLVKSAGALYPSSIDMHLSFLGAARPGPLVCEGEVLRLGKTVGFVEGRLMDADGRILVRATSSVLLVPAEKAS